MKPEIAKKWVEALRSGKYQQGSQQLIAETATGTKFCCLGVLCDLYLKEVKPADARWEHDTDSFIDHDGYAEHELLPAVVQDWAGVGDDVGSLPMSCGVPYDSLIKCNDNGFTFEQIATIIEKQAEML